MGTAATAWIVFRRSSRHTLRNPSFIIAGLLQPLLYLALFGPLLQRLSDISAFGGDSWRVFVPGLLVQQCVFASVFVGLGVIGEARTGVLDRMRVTPASQPGLLLGRMARDVAVLTIQAAFLVAAAVAAGLRAPVAGVALTFLLMALLGLATSAASYGVALRVPVEEIYGQLVNTVMLPTLLLSGVLLPMSLAPGWLAAVSRANPLSHIVSGARSLYAGDLLSADVVAAAGLAAALAALAVRFALRSLDRA